MSPVLCASTVECSGVGTAQRPGHPSGWITCAPKCAHGITALALSRRISIRSSVWSFRGPQDTAATEEGVFAELRSMDASEWVVLMVDIKTIAVSAYLTGDTANFDVNLARLVAKKAFTLRTLASPVNRRCARAR